MTVSETVAVGSKGTEEETEQEFVLTEWVMDPNEHSAFRIVEWPALHKFAIDWPGVEEVTELQRKKTLAKLLAAYDHWMAVIKRKAPKELLKTHVAPEAKEKLRVIGAALKEEYGDEIRPLTQERRKTLNEQLIREILNAKTAAMKPARQTKPRPPAKMWQPRQRPMNWHPPVEEPLLKVIFLDLSGRVKPGETIVSTVERQQATLTRSSDGNSITVKFNNSGLEKLYTQQTVLDKKEGWARFHTIVKCSKPVLRVMTNGVVSYQDYRNEYAATPIVPENPQTPLETQLETKPIDDLNRILSTEDPRELQIHAQFKVGNARYENKGFAIANTTPGLDWKEWRDVLYTKVKIVNNGKIVEIEDIPNAVNKFRMHMQGTPTGTKNPDGTERLGPPYTPTGVDLTTCVGIRGQLSEPWLTWVAKKLAYLQYVNNQKHSYTTIMTEELPIILAHLDRIPEGDLFPNTQRTGQAMNHTRSPEAQQLHDKMMVEA